MWSNRENNDFYEGISLSLLNEYEKQSGLDSSCDLNLVTPLLEKADNILEIGAGTGRVLKNLLSRQLKANILAIERSERLFSLLQAEFSKNLMLMKGDIVDIELNATFDIILWMWSGFSDFFPSEQAFLVKKLHSLLQSKGSLIIDTTRADVTPKNATDADGRFYQINIENVSINTYVPSEEEMQNYAQLADFFEIKIKHYITPTARPRTLYQLKKA